jgi:hypothetical protein
LAELDRHCQVLLAIDPEKLTEEQLPLVIEHEAAIQVPRARGAAIAVGGLPR